MTNIKQVGRVCRSVREERAITQAEMAERCGCSVSNIKHFEAGRCNNMMILIEYFKALNDDWDELEIEFIERLKEA